MISPDYCSLMASYNRWMNGRLYAACGGLSEEERKADRTRTQPNWLLASHLFNHGTHHRGQLTAALSQLGVDYGSTDLPFME